MSKKKLEKVDIILPSRLGDCIIAIPALYCLKELNDKQNKYKIRLISTNALTKIIESLNFFKVIELNLTSKFLSWLNPLDKMISLLPSTKILGYKAKDTYGQNIADKIVKFDKDMPYLNVLLAESFMDSRLFDFLLNEKNISTTGATYFGICLELGFSVDEIINAFKSFSKNSVGFKKRITGWIPDIVGKDYFVFCMEAAYGRKKDSDRRWDEDAYLEIAERVYNEYKMESAFIGLDSSLKLPDKPYFHDFRKSYSLEKVSKLLEYSRGYIGNDTGPLHIANLVKKTTVGVYFREASLVDYTPIFKELNHPIYNPENIEEVYNVVRSVAESNKKQMKISVVINTLNAEKFLKQCLESVKDFDEIILCDMYSEDSTVKIAEEYGCSIYYHEKVGYVEPARNFAISKATGDWVLVLDCDEVIPEALAKFFREFAKEDQRYSALAIPRKNWFFGKFVKGDWWPDRQMRFFKKGCVDWPKQIHLFPKVEGEVYKMPADNEELAILHYQCDSISDLVEKTNRYTDFEVEKHSRTKVTIKDILSRPLGVFVRMYFRQQGYKDGVHGFILAVVRGWLYRFLLLIKIWEYQNYRKEKSKTF